MDDHRSCICAMSIAGALLRFIRAAVQPGRRLSPQPFAAIIGHRILKYPQHCARPLRPVEVDGPLLRLHET